MAATFSKLGLAEPILRALRKQGYEHPTPIQEQAIPLLLEGRDLLGIAQTGTGKTAAFALPILDFLSEDPQPRVPKRPSVLVLTPTRELAAQIGESFEIYGANVDVEHTVVFGGVGQTPQVRAMRKGVDVLVATPGRLGDLMQQGHIDLRDIEVFVLDEADRMLDMGFIHEVRKITAKLPRDRQTLLFSATMPNEIAKLAQSILRDPARVEVTPPATTVERIEQSVMYVEKKEKPVLLAELLRDPSIERVLVFTRTKYGADKVVKFLRRYDIPAEAIHGNKSQNARERALEGFRSGRVRVLIATDIAARGIDVPGITHVINFDLPNIPASYVHRIGRTARAGRDGTAIAFCASDERPLLRDIEKDIRQKVPVVKAPELGPVPPPPRRPAQSDRSKYGKPKKRGAKKAGRKKPASSGNRRSNDARKPSKSKPKAGGPRKAGPSRGNRKPKRRRPS